MSRKVLLLTGSPRPYGNSRKLAEAFERGATQAGHQVVRYDTAGKRIFGCRACKACYTNRDACVFEDDFNALAPLVEEAEVIVIVTPLYWYTYPATLKAAIDKFYAFLIGKRAVAGKSCMLMACGSDVDSSVFVPLKKAYELTLSVLGWRDAGQLIVPGMTAAGEIQSTDYPRQAEQLGLDL